MKIKQGYLFLLPIFVFILFTNVVEVGAMNTGFETNQLSNEEKNVFISNINILLMDEEPKKNTIKCFDVNNEQLIAIGQNASDRKMICIYSNDGIFLYGYVFNCSGDFGVEWDEENLNIYFIRSSMIVSVTPRGEVLGVFEVQNTIENNSYVNNFIHSTKKTIGNTEYLIRNNLGILNLFASSYSQILVKDSTGTQNIIYDVGSMQLLNLVISIIAIGVIICVAILFVVWQLIKKKGVSSL